MNDKTVTTLGRTKIVRDSDGRIISQSLPEGAWQRGPQPPIPTRPKRPGPTPLADILIQVENIERELAEATSAYEASLAPGQADPHHAEKCDLVLKIQALKKQLDPLEARLSELQSLPSPAQQFKLTVADLERLTNASARLLTDSLSHAKALELHDQPLESLPRDVQKILLNRNDVSVVRDIAAPGFSRFNRVPEEVRTTDQAKSTTGRIIDAVKLIAGVITSKLS